MLKSKTRALVLAAATTLLWSFAAADAQHAHGTPPATVKSEILPVENRTAGKPVPTVIRLTSANGKPVTLDQLEVAHTEKIHLLVIDQSLTDYHHLHPVATDKSGDYRFEFAPRSGGTYHIWADLVPKSTGKQEYSKTTVKVDGPPATPDNSTNTTAEVDGYRFDLTTENDAPLQAGKATTVKVKVTGPDGREFSKLEPVMGAFAHMVAFPEDLASVTHVHPMGIEPKTAAERGGPELSFHVEGDKPGFHKFFLQMQIGGKDKFAAFGLKVEPGASTKTTSPTGTRYFCPMHPEVKQPAPGKCPKCGMALVAK